ncbi:BON domain-containing protein [Marinicella rhabdoformis]|uniref:BON domain-containing protein n=1 Tax=Marinicella rhabdoformis TaxID=2580566 RepID=UPI0012AEC19D|nr:BON domain-containing protein [Marinicella rhabdoformis]
MKINTQKTKTAIKTTLFAATLAVTPIAFAGNNGHYDSDDKLKDAWLDGKIEAALLVNRHLNNFAIDTDVKGQVAHLSGTVNSNIDKELAEEIAKGIKGVSKVKNNLVVDEKQQPKKAVKGEERSFGTWYDDATTTAAVKSSLLLNKEASGMKVNVDTLYGIVTLSGEVSTAQEVDLIIKLAENTSGVRDVKSQLKVKS